MCLFQGTSRKQVYNRRVMSIHIKPVIQHAVAIFFDVGCCIGLTTLSTPECKYLFLPSERLCANPVGVGHQR